MGVSSPRKGRGLCRRLTSTSAGPRIPGLGAAAGPRGEGQMLGPWRGWEWAPWGCRQAERALGGAAHCTAPSLAQGPRGRFTRFPGEVNRREPQEAASSAVTLGTRAGPLLSGSGGLQPSASPQRDSRIVVPVSSAASHTYVDES